MLKSKKRVFSIILTIAVMMSMVLSIPFTSHAAVNAGYSYLIARANSNIVSADNTGTSPLVASRATASDWEAFKIINNSDGTISFLAQANNLYVCADLNQSSKLIARSATIDAWEKFTIVPQADGTVAFLAMANNQYVSTDLNNGAVLYANKAAVGGAWEAYTIVTPGGATTTPAPTVTPTPTPATTPGVTSTPTPTAQPTTSPTTPDFGPNVYIFDPNMSASTIQNTCNSVFSQQESNQFGTNRYALLFKPGTYNVDVNVGFYTQVLGLGQSPDNVNINGAVHVEADWMSGNATCNFWRAAENLAVTPSGGTDRWAVSQAISFRRMHVKGNMILDDNGWSSGGYLADTLVDGQINSGSQQQWYSRNAQIGSWTGQNWNHVFQGVVNAPSGASWPNPSYTVIGQTPVVREKPFLYVDSSGNYNVLVPSLKTNSSGISWASGSTPGTSLPISQFYIVKSGDTAATMNAALTQGKNLLFTPGIYHLNDTLRVTRADTVILGLGLATLVPDNGVIAMSVSDVDGVKIAGILFDAGTVNSPVLLEVGPTGSSADHSVNPTSIHDVYFRTGGAGVGKASCSLKINSNNVIGDNFWIWRADHGSGVGWTSNTSTNGMIVNGQNVTIYALFVEHHQQYQTLWNGNGGRVYFYQSEIPYDVPNQSSWMNGSVNGFASYKVANSVTSHEAWGLGIYCYFSTNPSCKLASAIDAPNTANVKFHNITTVCLGGAGEITHIVNNTGNAANSSNTVQRLASYP